MVCAQLLCLLGTGSQRTVRKLLFVSSMRAVAASLFLLLWLFLLFVSGGCLIGMLWSEMEVLTEVRVF